MAVTLLHKRSGTNLAIPTAGNLSTGEIAINTRNAKLFIKDFAGNIVQFCPLNNGDKGDITVSNDGQTFTIDNAVVTVPKISATGTADNTTFLRGDGAWAAPSVGGGGSDGTIPLITQAYAATECYGPGDFNFTYDNNARVRFAQFTNTYGALVNRAGVIELHLLSTAITGSFGNQYSTNTASLGGFFKTDNTIYKAATSQYLTKTTVTAVVRIPTLPNASNPFQCGVCFTDTMDFFSINVPIGSFGIVVYADRSFSNWKIRYSGGDTMMGELITYEVDSGVVKNTAWRKIQIITENNSNNITYTIKIDDNTVHTITSDDLYNNQALDMTIAPLLTPHVAIRSAGNGGAGRFDVDYFTVLSEVSR